MGRNPATLGYWRVAQMQIGPVGAVHAPLPRARDPLQVSPGEKRILDAYDKAKQAGFGHGMSEIAKANYGHIEKMCGQAEVSGQKIPIEVVQELKKSSDAILTDCLERKVSPIVIVYDLRKLLA